VRGPSLFRATLESTRDGALSHFFLGSTDEVLEALSRNVSIQHEGVRIAGTYSPPYADIDDGYVAKCAQLVREAKPDILWLGLGTPKQDTLGTRLAYMLDIPIVNVGAAFDFVAGTVAEAPPWLRGSGFEWMFRFAKEPRRLWKRYIFGNLRFVWATLTRWRE
jgi:N-acetylglucosaminyldiphosphoundecaprenol N-acetyl-beta-D-mannosaminyltransferase